MLRPLSAIGQGDDLDFLHDNAVALDFDHLHARARLDVAAVGHDVYGPSILWSDDLAEWQQTETSPQLMAENVAQVFLGTRIQCAQCHNHPFDRWTLGD